jgi:hypothetical protein
VPESIGAVDDAPIHSQLPSPSRLFVNAPSTPVNTGRCLPRSQADLQLCRPQSVFKLADRFKAVESQ